MSGSNHLTGIRVPTDVALPGLASLLDADRLAELLPGLFPNTVITGCRPLYVRYKPGTNVVAAWAVELADQIGVRIIHGKAHTLDHFDTAREKVETARWLETEGGRPYCAVPEQALLLFSFPNDPTLDGLRLATNNKKMQRALYACVKSHPETEWRISDRRMVITPIRFKPEKRAVLRIDTKAVNRSTGCKDLFRIYARVSNNPRAASVAQLMNRLNSELADHAFLRTPPALAYLPESGVTLVPDAGGELLSTDQSGVQAAGRALAVLHGLAAGDLPPLEFSEVVAAALDNATTVGNLMPELEAEVQQLSASLAARAGAVDVGQHSLVHGDFHPEQLLTSGDHITLLDFDRSYTGNSAADLGNYCAHLIYQNITDNGATPDDLMTRFVAAYVGAGAAAPAAADLAFWTALSLLNLAPTPFRSLNRNWPWQTRDLLAACRRELA